MIDFVLWFMVICSFLANVVFVLLFLTTLRAFLRLMDRVDELEGDLMQKMDRPKSPPTYVPLD